ncbi:hypothetical protein Q1695_002831 [Nippostrongylus brasiliensis]|nr:hypothetical protein Q1695_002831 [Nippostrongylus brasiliensis]
MTVMLMCFLAITVNVGANQVAEPVNGSEIRPILTCASVDCIQGYKCVMTEPADCVGCSLRFQCVQQQCDTTCTCGKLSNCVLVATECCPKPTCRRQFTLEPYTMIFTIGPGPETMK